MPFTRRRRSRKNVRSGRSLRKWGGGVKCKKCNCNCKLPCRCGLRKRRSRRKINKKKKQRGG